MKRNTYLIFIGLTLFFGVSSCDSDFEKVPVEEFTLEYVFSRTDSVGKNARYFLNEIYGVMLNGHNRVGGDYLDAATDDAITSALSENDVYKLSVGRFTSNNRVGSDMKWEEFYKGIRKVNIFINNIDVVPLMEKFDNNVAKNISMNRAWKAESRFLRAYFYFELMKRYGGVTLVGDIPFKLNDNLELPRNTFEECVDYIVDELDAIKDSLRTLPIANAATDGHVVTQEAAMALKSRVLLYAASPLFNESPIEKSNPLVGYTTYSPERWKKAADAAKWFISKYPNYSLAPDFNAVFLGYYSDNNKELIFFHQAHHGKEIEQNNGPVGFTGDNLGRGRTSPTQNLVDAFPMLDGKPIGESSKYPYSYVSMYKNRDPRLEKTILHNESRWLNRNIETFEGGLNNPSGSNQKTKTSYYMRKFMGNFENSNQYDNTYHLWVMYRYAEILLNYAEALNEYSGPADEVYDCLIALRQRAGIEAGDDGMYGLKAGMDKGEMRKAIQNERRIEMAFEEHRYWDIRRWKIAEEVFSKPLEGMMITKYEGVLNYTPTTVLTTSFDEKRYLYPIPYAEVIKNKNMVQNPKWN